MAAELCVFADSDQRYKAHRGRREKHSAGHTVINLYRESELAWVVPSCPDKNFALFVERAIALAEELCILAHEFGHFELDHGGDNDPGVMPTQIYQDEVNAWDVAKRVLEEIGFEEWSTFEAVKNEGLNSYSVLLK